MKASEQASLFGDEPAPNSPDDIGFRAVIRFQIPADARSSACRSCGATVFWIETHRAKWMPVDRDGTSHFANCPHAAQHRRPR